MTTRLCIDFIKKPPQHIYYDLQVWKSSLPFAAPYTLIELLDGFSRLVMNGQRRRTLHSDTSCKPLCLMTPQRGPRLDHPSEVLRSSPSPGGSQPRRAMRGVTCPLPIRNSLSIFFYKWPVALAPFVCFSFHRPFSSPQPPFLLPPCLTHLPFNPLTLPFHFSNKHRPF